MKIKNKLNYSLAVLIVLVIIPIGISFFAYLKINNNVALTDDINVLTNLFFKENYLINNYSHYLDEDLDLQDKNIRLSKIEDEFLSNLDSINSILDSLEPEFRKKEDVEALEKASSEIVFLKEEFLKIKDIFINRRTGLAKNDLLKNELAEKTKNIENSIFTNELRNEIASSSDYNYFALFSDFQKIKSQGTEFLFNKKDKVSFDELSVLLDAFNLELKKIEYFNNKPDIFLSLNDYQSKLKVFLDIPQQDSSLFLIDRELLLIDKRVSYLLESSSDSPLLALKKELDNKIKNIILISLFLLFLFVFGILIFFVFVFRGIKKEILGSLSHLSGFISKIAQNEKHEKFSFPSQNEFNPLVESLDKLEERFKKSQVDLVKKVDELKVKENINSLVETLTDGIIMYNKEKEIILKNSAVDNILNISNKKISLKNLYSIFAKHNLKFHIDLSLRTEEVYKIDNVDLFSNLYELTITQVKNHNNDIVGGLIIFHKKENCEVNKHEDDKKIDFSPVISPRFGTPLSYIKLFTEMLSSGKIGQLNKEQKECIVNIHRSAINMKELVDKLQDVALLNDDNLEVNTEEVDIAKFIRELVNNYKERNKIVEKEINFKELLPSDIKISIDKEIFSKVFYNILDNALVYSEGKSNIIDIELKELGFNYLLSVKDYGIGILEEEQDFVFDKFFRAKNAMMENTEGSGISLYIAKKLLTKVGVELFFESKIGEGSTFFIEIPKGGMRK